jgi:glyoxylase-like metal-dependent hydrolase (beta-lactamase superfamily II)
MSSAPAGRFRTRPGLNRLIASGPEPIADGVWVVRGGFPKTMNVYLVRDGDGVLAFDAGISAMAGAVADAARSLGGLTRIVLGHGHADHRGVAPALSAVPVLCHPDEVADAEGDGGAHYFRLDQLEPHGRLLLGSMLPVWDGGPVAIDATVSEGDDVAGFQVVHFPGHAPGLIGLWRASDRLALVSDTLYTVDPQTGIPGHARVPHRAFNWDTEVARASIRKLATLNPATVWAGHAGPLTGDVAGQLERAAATT